MDRKPRYEAQRRFSGEQKREMAERQEYICGGCGQSFWRKPLSSVQAHHIWPFSFGGVTETQNGVLLCPECHHKADKYTMIEGRVWPGNYSMRDVQPEQKRKR